jgi:conjugative relaxase-like TrwC/TraI family protein
MLSISNVGAKQAASYYDKDGYYARMEDNSDHWQGRLKEDLNLSDDLTKEDFNALVNEREERAGYDLCFSAPKSVSIAMCLGGENRQGMISAHNIAVKTALELIEQREIGARITKDKVTKHVKTGNMITGCFNHYVSRNQDPQLHTHAVILNKTKHNDKFYAVDNPDLYRNNILYGQIYRNVLAKQLMDRGYEIIVTDSTKGFFELKGIEQGTIEQFSSRRQEILEKLKEWGTSTPKAASAAAMMTRKAKEHKDMDVLMKSWQETLKDVGGVDIAKSEIPVISTPDQRKVEFDQAVKRLSSRAFAFTERELKKAVLASGVGSGMSEIQYNELLKSDAGKILVTLGGRQDIQDDETYYTTLKNLENEKKFLTEVARSKGSMPGLKAREVEGVLDKALKKEEKGLSGQQRDAVLHIVTTNDQYSAVQGLAGTGKTHMLNYARQVLENSGYTVKGACYTGKAAQGLEEDARIPSNTIHSFLNQLEREAGNAKPDEDMQLKTDWNLDGLKPGSAKEAWIIDEASMVDNNTMLYISEAAKIKNAKVVLVGDRQQLLPVGIGNAYSVLTETGKISTVRLDEIRRQKDKDLLRAVREAVSGDIVKSLELIEKDTQVIPKHKERIKAIVNDYTALTLEEQKMTVILTAANKDRHSLNQSIRAELIKQGHLAAGRKCTVADVTGKTSMREFSLRDKVIFLQNNYKMGVRNGQTGVIKNINNNILTIESGGKEIVLNLEKYNKIDHGYAMTGHKAQGITTDRVMVNLDSTQKQMNSRNAFYVDISRARHEVKIYTDDTVKIQGQIKNFAKKLTSDDFLIPEKEHASGKKQGFDMIIQSFKGLKKEPKIEIEKQRTGMSF